MAPGPATRRRAAGRPRLRRRRRGRDRGSRARCRSPPPRGPAPAGSTRAWLPKSRLAVGSSMTIRRRRLGERPGDQRELALAAADQGVVALAPDLRSRACAALRARPRDRRRRGSRTAPDARCGPSAPCPGRGMENAPHAPAARRRCGARSRRAPCAGSGRPSSSDAAAKGRQQAEQGLEQRGLAGSRWARAGRRPRRRRPRDRHPARPACRG